MSVQCPQPCPHCDVLGWCRIGHDALRDAPFIPKSMAEVIALRERFEDMERRLHTAEQERDDWKARYERDQDAGGHDLYLRINAAEQRVRDLEQARGEE